MNDTDTQAKRLVIWQTLLREMPSEHRKILEAHPKGELFNQYSAIVTRRLLEWQKQRDLASKMTAYEQEILEKTNPDGPGNPPQHLPGL